MARGKHTCKILKEIRRQIAEANGIDLTISECRYKGDCAGTCPKCESEVRYLEQQLRDRRMSGKAVALAGISAASLALLVPFQSEAQPQTNIDTTSIDSLTTASVNIEKVKGIVACKSQADSDSIKYGELTGASISNITRGTGTVSNVDGEFEIEACPGDSIKVSFIGCLSKTICVSNTSEPISVVLEEDETLSGTILGTIGIICPPELPYGKLDLYFRDEKGNRIDPSYITLYKIYIDEDGDEDEDIIYGVRFFDENPPIQLDWIYNKDLQDDNGKPLKEVKLRIEFDNYEDNREESMIIKLKYPKRNTKKTIKFKPQKK